MLRNFLFNVAGVTGSFTLRSREAECLENIRTAVGSHKVLVSRAVGDTGACAGIIRFVQTVMVLVFVLFGLGKVT